jgi:predicted DNA binding CopG/RHH family protein
MKYNTAISVRIDKEELEAFTKVCKEEARNRQAVIRKLVELYTTGQIKI